MSKYGRLKNKYTLNGGDAVIITTNFEEQKKAIKGILVLYILEIDEEYSNNKQPYFGEGYGQMKAYAFMQNSKIAKRFVLEKAVNRFTKMNPKTNGLALLEVISEIKEQIDNGS